MTETKTRKPLLCRLHLHQLSLDACRYTRAEICNRCGEYPDEWAKEKLFLEYALWKEAARLFGHDLHLQNQYVLAHLTGIGKDLVLPRPEPVSNETV